jgi:IS30 family transposase
MRERRRAPAGGVQAEKQQRYVRLIAQGVSNAEAWRLVGINRRTGTRWRYGRSVRNSAGEVLHYPPVKITEAKPRSPRYLSEHERIAIADLLVAGMSVRGIATEMGRHLDGQPGDPAQQRPGRSFQSRFSAGVRRVPLRVPYANG